MNNYNICNALSQTDLNLYWVDIEFKNGQNQLVKEKKTKYRRWKARILKTFPFGKYDKKKGLVRVVDAVYQEVQAYFGKGFQIVVLYERKFDSLLNAIQKLSLSSKSEKINALFEKLKIQNEVITLIQQNYRRIRYHTSTSYIEFIKTIDEIPFNDRLDILKSTFSFYKQTSLVKRNDNLIQVLNKLKILSNNEREELCEIGNKYVHDLNGDTKNSSWMDLFPLFEVLRPVPQYIRYKKLKKIVKKYKNTGKPINLKVLPNYFKNEKQIKLRRAQKFSINYLQKTKKELDTTQKNILIDLFLTTPKKDQQSVLDILLRVPHSFQLIKDICNKNRKRRLPNLLYTEGIYIEFNRKNFKDIFLCISHKYLSAEGFLNLDSKIKKIKNLSIETLTYLIEKYMFYEKSPLFQSIDSSSDSEDCESIFRSRREFFDIIYDFVRFMPDQTHQKAFIKRIKDYHMEHETDLLENTLDLWKKSSSGSTYSLFSLIVSITPDDQKNVFVLLNKVYDEIKDAHKIVEYIIENYKQCFTFRKNVKQDLEKALKQLDKSSEKERNVINFIQFMKNP